MPEIAAIEQFMKVSGPWALIGLFLFLWWDNTRRKGKDAAEFYEQFAAYLTTFTAHDAVCRACQLSLLTLVERVTQNGNRIETLTMEIRGIARPITRGGRTGA